MTEGRVVIARGWRGVIVSWVQSFSFEIRFLERDDCDDGGKMLI